jgi:hypothetical protein
MTFAGAGLAVAAAALAQLAPTPDVDPPTVALAISGDSALAGRLKAELSAAGFGVTLLEGSAALGGCSAGDEAHPTRARIVVRRAPGAGGGATPEVCVLARDSGEVVMREVLKRDASDANADGILAVRVVELLRASLLETGGSRPPAAAGDVAPAAPVVLAEVGPAPAAGASERRGLLVDLGAGANMNVGVGDVAPGLALTLWWPLLSRAGVGAGVSGPAGAGHISAGSESADVYVSTLTAGVRYALLGARGAWTLHAGAGASLLWFNLQGRAAGQGNVPRTDNLIVGGPHADVRLSFRVSGRVAFYSQLRGTYSIPEPVVAFAERDVARLGRPLLAWTIGIECRPAGGGTRD